MGCSLAFLSLSPAAAVAAGRLAVDPLAEDGDSPSPPPVVYSCVIYTVTIEPSMYAEPSFSCKPCLHVTWILAARKLNFALAVERPADYGMNDLLQ